MSLGKKWEELQPPISPSVLFVLHNYFGFKTTTPVQAAAVPLLLSSKDVCAEACTGSGKTLAYVIPTIEILLKYRKEELAHSKQPQHKKMDYSGCSPTVASMMENAPPELCYAPVNYKNKPKALIVAPTRELALQVMSVVEPFAAMLGFPTLSLIGKTSDESEDRLKLSKHGVAIVVGTPGKLEKVFCGRVLNEKSKVSSSYGSSEPLLNGTELEVLILDEADRLLDLGFAKAINAILPCLNKQRRTGLFSATQTAEVKQLARAGLRNPFRITVHVQNSKNKQEQVVPQQLNVFYSVVPLNFRFSHLANFVSKGDAAHKKTIVFFLTRACVNYFYNCLKQLQMTKYENDASLKSMNFFSLHGDMPQNKRISTLDKFRNTANSVLLCTDVAARGLDLPDVDWIVQFDAPQDPDTFIHRVGRTARMGKAGKAVVFLTEREVPYEEFLRRKQVPIENLSLPENVENLTPKIQSIMAHNRELFDKSRVAFVSYVRAYQEHVLTAIFQKATLDLAALAEGFALLKLPKMPELKQKQISYQPPEVDISKIPYLDKVREAKRQQEEANKPVKKKKNNPALNIHPNAPWSKKKQEKALRQERKRKRQKRKEYEKSNKERKSDQPDNEGNSETIQ